jgi:predicted nucleic acid-binding protein
MPLLLISDANILIDMEAGELLERLFRLPMQLAIPDVLYWEEIEPGTSGLQELGLQVMEVTGDYVAYALGLSAKYGSAPSSNDYLALALAKQEDCPLLTGDQALKAVALAENVSVMGTLWLIRAMVENQLLTVDAAFAALARMKARNRRLPWGDAERILNSLR